MDHHRRVVVTGLGVVSPVGNTVNQVWEALLQGKSGVGELKLFDSSAYPTRIAAEVRDFDPAQYLSVKEQKHSDRFVKFAVAAAKQAAADAAISADKEDPNRIGVWIGTGMGGLATIEEGYRDLEKRGPARVNPFFIPMIICNMAPGQVSISLGFKGPNSCSVSACASGAHAIGDSYKIIQRGEADAMVAGGSECAITPLGVAGFCALRALSTRNDDPQHASRPFDLDRDGFVIGEGAAVVVLEELEHAKRRGAKIYAEMIGYGMTGDAHHMTAPDPDGAGAAGAMTLALKSAGLKPADIQYINAHGTSTKLNDKIETKAIKDVFGEAARKLAISSTKSMTGHLLGAAGAVEFLACCLSLKNQIVHGTMNYTTPDPDCDLDYVPNEARRMKLTRVLSNSLGFGGHNVSLIAQKYEG
ncbi:MAG: beta-ketoacyl-[acyl-carrier-protein] synthase II [Candidatus Omnitrophica bacterium CG11_big_fil_rev_8_21_14_0_20_64_10]|nr:MAG: beta-ketoacyl-[acyl-carrier-protein] synthase II [Candidatus Omnitrophica bacterium CG11_big_fil_rev_8_21_14_0_20_64_10]